MLQHVQTFESGILQLDEQCDATDDLAPLSTATTISNSNCIIV